MTIIAYRAIARDPNHYTEPSRFNPDRFLPNGDPLYVCPLDPQLYAFGFGRR
jgi:cytochrome P450